MKYFVPVAFATIMAAFPAGAGEDCDPVASLKIEATGNLALVSYCGEVYTAVKSLPTGLYWWKNSAGEAHALHINPEGNIDSTL